MGGVGKEKWKYQDIRKSVAACATRAMNREGRCTTLVRPRSSFESIVCRTFRGRCIGYFCRCAAMRHTTQSTFPFSRFNKDFASFATVNHPSGRRSDRRILAADNLFKIFTIVCNIVQIRSVALRVLRIDRTFSSSRIMGGKMK